MLRGEGSTWMAVSGAPSATFCALPWTPELRTALSGKSAETEEESLSCQRSPKNRLVRTLSR
jgi:hypothetical protein